MRLLSTEGTFDNSFFPDYFSKMVPWIHNKTIEILDDQQDCGICAKTLLDDKSKNIIMQHKEVLDKERKRKEDIIAEHKRKLHEEEVARTERRKIRAEKRRLRDLKLLHDHINEVIIKKGVEGEEIIKQDIWEVDGFLQGQEIVG